MTRSELEKIKNESAKEYDYNRTFGQTAVHAFESGFNCASELLMKEIASLQEKLNKCVEAMSDVRSELTSANINNEWCIDQICEALAEIRKKE